MPIDVRGAEKTADRERVVEDWVPVYLKEDGKTVFKDGKPVQIGERKKHSYTLHTSHYLIETVVGELMLGSNVEWVSVPEQPATEAKPRVPFVPATETEPEQPSVDAVEAREAQPAHEHTRLNPAAGSEEPESGRHRARGVDIHLRDGLKPDAQGRVRGRIEFKVREVSASLGNEKSYYVYLNVFPSETPGNARVRVVAGAGTRGTDKNGFGVQIIKPRE